MAIQLNCECDCEYPSKTLLQLRTSVIAGLGYIDPLAIEPTRPLGVLMGEVLDRLGFIDALGIEVSTLVEMRIMVRDRLGLAGYVDVNIRTVADMLSDLYYALGMGAQASNPAPGKKQELIAVLNQAQQILFRRLELDKGRIPAERTPPAPLAADGDQTTIDGTLVYTLALAMAKAHATHPDAKVYHDQVEKYLADQIQRNPPNIEPMIDRALQEAQRTIYRRFELNKTGTITIAPFEEDTDSSTLDYHLIMLLALANLKAKTKQEDAKAIMEEFERLMADTLRRAPPNIVAVVELALQSAHRSVLRRYELGNSGAFTPDVFASPGDYTSCDDQPVFLLACANLAMKYKMDDAKAMFAEYEEFMKAALQRSPPNVTSVVNRALKMAQETLYRRHSIFRMERWFTWTLTAGERFYGVAENDETQGDPVECAKTLDMRKVRWVGVSTTDGDEWRSLRHGIPPEVYQGNQSGVPTHYETRQCIEVWPAPVAGWKLRVKGTFGLLPFEADDDVTSIDWQVVELQALADAKATYKQVDAELAMRRAENYIRNIVAGEHQTARYIPGSHDVRNAVRPVMAPTET